jgi:hypothetical protein
MLFMCFTNIEIGSKLLRPFNCVMRLLCADGFLSFRCCPCFWSKFNRIYLGHLLFFLSGEGPRSRRYGRTAALRLIVQPCDEDEDDDYFLSFS